MHGSSMTLKTTLLEWKRIIVCKQHLPTVFTCRSRLTKISGESRSLEDSSHTCTATNDATPVIRIVVYSPSHVPASLSSSISKPQQHFHLKQNTQILHTTNTTKLNHQDARPNAVRNLAVHPSDPIFSCCAGSE